MSVLGYGCFLALEPSLDSWGMSSSG